MIAPARDGPVVVGAGTRFAYAGSKPGRIQVTGPSGGVVAASEVSELTDRVPAHAVSPVSLQASDSPREVTHVRLHHSPAHVRQRSGPRREAACRHLAGRRKGPARADGSCDRMPLHGCLSRCSSWRLRQLRRRDMHAVSGSLQVAIGHVSLADQDQVWRGMHQGLRWSTLKIGGISVTEQPKLGRLILAGPSFRYVSGSGAHGADSFKLRVDGSSRAEGNATLRMTRFRRLRPASHRPYRRRIREQPLP